MNYARISSWPPLWLLQHLSIRSNLEARLGLITGFLILFTGLLSALAVAKTIEILAATATYAAVLMVFIQVGSSGGGANSN